MPSIREALLESNPWWGGPFEVKFKERDIYSQIRRFMKLPQIVAFTGLRRVGKSTLMYKIIKEALTAEFDSRSIIYFSFDEFGAVELREVIAEYEKIIGGKFNEKKRIFLLDEIQRLTGWEEQLKRIYDLNYGKAKIIISGSESLFIKKKSKETLAGRIFEFKINTLTFREFLRFKNFRFDNVEIYSKELSILFEEFILMCGFPELIGVKEKDIIKKYVKENIVEKIIYNDIPKLFKVDKPEILESILRIIMEDPGEIINIVDLANDLQIERHTASNYLSYLEHSFLIRKLYNFSRTRRKVEKSLKKYYPEIISPDLIFKEDTLRKSQVFESVIVKLLEAEYFWIDVYKNEVDIVLEDGKNIMPIEIKYGREDFKGITSFLSKFSLEKGYIISYKNEHTVRINGKTIDIIPAFKFLLQEKEVRNNDQLEKNRKEKAE